MFYHIVTVLQDEEEIVAKYEEYSPDVLNSKVAFFCYPIKRLLECSPLQTCCNQLIKEGHTRNELFILRIDSLEQLKLLSKPLRETIFSNCLFINMGITEPFNDLYKNYF